MVAEVRPDHETEWAATNAVASKLGIGAAETVRQWVRRDQIDSGSRPGTTTEESAQFKALNEGSRRVPAGERDPQGGLAFLRGRTRPADLRS
ncbi:hypothetical protein SCOCK_540032 [Actinacidiphila cocklensis]|jgi:transposase|uniref:Transposase n=1 Tax=Actinacidiphila cocklensis TaxID=887465 RepID=A0A9W4E0X0_9ACTN|nr:hypothetical protein SCOCK_540032 [Actinacidiphila cocklensis]